jgi:hypothetical protein
MSYGIEILNNNDRIVIDLNYANFGLFSNSLSTATPGSTYPGLANTTSSDLILARANNTANGRVARGVVANTWCGTTDEAASAIRYYVLRRFDQLNPSTAAGYGVAVYNTSSNVIFTSNIAKNFEIVAAGTHNSAASNTLNIAFPSSTTWYSDFDKYYCAVNASICFYLVIPSFPNALINAYRVAYRYQWANSTHGRIIVESQYFNGTSNTTLNRDFHYMILKELT